MKLETLERADHLIRLNHFLGNELEEVFVRNGETVETYRLVRWLVDNRQFDTLLHLKKAEHHALCALEGLTPDTAYLCHELEQHLQGLQLLLQKMEQEEHLRRDREVLLSLDPVDPEQGVAEWTSGKSTG